MTETETSSRVAIVTGAAGGVGSAVVQTLRDRGVKVIAEDINHPALEERFAHDDGVAILAGDVSSAATAEQAAAIAVERFGRLDVLVNNAGKFHSKPLQATTDNDWDDLMRVNVRGVFVHSRACMPLLARQGGAIVNVASISGLVGLPHQLAYAATKGAIVQMTRQLAIEHAAQGIRVNAVAPGAINTPFMDNAMQGDPNPEATMAAIAASHPMGKVSTPQQVAAVIDFLVSESASSMTGAVVPVDGGFTAA